MAMAPEDIDENKFNKPLKQCQPGQDHMARSRGSYFQLF